MVVYFRYLHNNRLTTIPSGSFSDMPRLRKLRLDSNALVCDCSLLWMVRMLANHSDMSVVATCYEPATVTGTSLAAMSEKDFKCRESILPDNGGGMLLSFCFRF